MTEEQTLETCAHTQLHQTSALRRKYAAAKWVLATDGFAGAVRRAVRSVMPASSQGSAPKTPTPPIEGEVLGLQPGELVEVKSEEEIRALLNKYRATRGLFFMDEMWKYCGRQFRVLKRLDRIVVESTGEVRQLKNTVLLEGVHCDGSAHSGCSATCFHYWREAWLRRVDEPAEAQATEGAAAAPEATEGVAAEKADVPSSGSAEPTPS